LYSHEIDSLLKSRNYTVSAADYISICNSSPQIDHIKACGDFYMLWTVDGYFWKITVRKELL
jgi:cupin superfamily acireductone dioxygenase involved in methionine salvage